MYKELALIKAVHFRGRSMRQFPTSMVSRSPYEEGPGKNLLYSMENKSWLLIMMARFFGSGLASPFFIVRRQLLKI
ncbi:cytochrome c oxidase subunit 7C, mitochondrial-like [Echinops telfairi]|uniref:Cytochrome c oxidase subunit 7C, mitochondrial-like n=1 Tax=Echinops telfairi TaxID=9371 RepID=A0AC55CSQ8_ECHTE|nr:cytochrome c oxidase subunit 7C, mitochondrial-like [Echinops telfairi]